MRRVDGCRDLLALHRLNPQRYPHLLESVAHGTPHGRYDILFAFPGASLQVSAMNGMDFLRSLDARWSAERIPRDENCTLPFRGGWFLYLGYELAAQIEPRLRLAPAPHALPPAFATRIPAAVISDRHAAQTWLVAESHVQALLDVMAGDLQAAQTLPTQARPFAVRELEEDPAEGYLQAVRRIKRYILDGDVFQVNLSRLWQGELNAENAYADLYASLRRRNPAPFAGLATWRDTAILSSSPERLLQVRGEYVQTRPIAGTRPRSGERQRDADYSRELLAHPKERAEHIMLIDLERNDLGRVCIPGSVRVDELMSLESYAHVHHIVSNVRGRKHRDVTPGQVIGAVFPGGTITGCPKVRCMEIIAELEETGRGPYTGSFGYLNHDGDMDLNILIRTLVTEGSRFSLRAGAGIVADSEPTAELAETRAKARGMLLALGIDGGAFNG
jgi:4-amino-4-deoxychorismate synthase (2-amino-4-deoxychorismate-forming) component I